MSEAIAHTMNTEVAKHLPANRSGLSLERGYDSPGLLENIIRQ